VTVWTGTSEGATTVTVLAGRTVTVGSTVLVKVPRVLETMVVRVLLVWTHVE
jgi:hypothetical protein